MMIWPTKIRYKNPKINELGPEEELIIYEIHDFIRLRVIEGQAEVYGRELPVGRRDHILLRGGEPRYLYLEGC